MDLTEALTTLSTRIVDGSSVLSEIQDDLDDLRDAMPSAAESVQLSPVPPQVEELTRSMDLLVAAPEAAPLPLRFQGSGSRSLTSLLVFRAFVRLRQGGDRPLAPLPISAFEEPEAHLHPHAQRTVHRQIEAFDGQKLITTHSTQIAAQADPRSLRRLYRTPHGVGVAQLPDGYPDDDVRRLQRFLLRTTPEALFARLVILVEGETEEALLPPLLAHHLAPRDPDGEGLVVASTDGVTKFPQVAAALEALGIPWLALADGDPAGDTAVARLSQRLGRDVAADPVHVFQLPTPHDLESYLLDDRRLEALERAIRNADGDDALERWSDERHGKPRRGGREPRDFRGPDGPTELVDDYLRGHKGTLGAFIADQLIADGHLPAAFGAVFDRANALFAGDDV